MAAFEDLSPYTYFPEAADTFNVGWLAPGHLFPTGDTTAEFRDKLRLLCDRRVQQTRGLHRCDFCKGGDRPASSSEMRVSGGGRRVYAAPTMVQHYVEVHGYRPPDEFIAAVLVFAPDAEPGAVGAD